MSRRALFGLGSNLGDRWSFLQAGADGLAFVGRDSRVSRIFESAPVGGPDGQGAYLNCVVVVTTELDPAALLATANALEAAAGRERTVRWGPRTLDVDILFVDGVTSDDPVLTIPHPRVAERSFVLAPLEELDPALADPGWRARLGASVLAAQGVHPVGAMLQVPGGHRR